MRNKILIFVIALAMNFSFSGVTNGADFIAPSKKDKCPVCGMFVYKYPNWIAEIIFKDGSYAAFDGPKDMFRYYFNISKYDKSKTRDDIAEIYVTEHYSARPMKAEGLFFVVGSDVYGPMGEELIPVKGKEAAESFMKDHTGQKVFTFEQITGKDIPGMEMMHGHEMYEGGM
jgi:nitrous oxide reductase accessory protein NosL